jgi:hypothetical protein
MKILYCTESSPEYFMQNSKGIDIQEKSEIFVIGDLTYCCEALEKNFWLELIQAENYNEPNELKVVLGCANYSGGYTIIGGTDGIRFCPFCGTKIELEKVISGT